MIAAYTLLQQTRNQQPLTAASPFLLTRKRRTQLPPSGGRKGRTCGAEPCLSLSLARPFPEPLARKGRAHRASVVDLGCSAPSPSDGLGDCCGCCLSWPCCSYPGPEPRVMAAASPV